MVNLEAEGENLKTLASVEASSSPRLWSRLFSVVTDTSGMADACSLIALKPMTDTRILVSAPPVSGWAQGAGHLRRLVSALYTILWSHGLSLINYLVQDFTRGSPQWL